MKHSDDRSPCLDDGLRRRLDIFAEILTRWTVKINLISQTDIPMLWPRHIADSLQLLPFVPEGCSRGIDLGSGAGFPGLILALASNVTFDLIESDSRKAAFLREAARATGAPVAIHNTRIERTALPRASMITARAAADLSRLLSWAHPLLVEGGVCLFLKGRNAQAEIAHAHTMWRMRVEMFASVTNAAGSILKITDLHYVGPHGRTR